MIQVKSAKEIEIMKKANQIAADALIVAGNAITPGMSLLGRFALLNTASAIGYMVNAITSAEIPP